MHTEIVIRMGDKTSTPDGCTKFKILGTVQKTTQITSKSQSPPDLEAATELFKKAYKEAMIECVRYAPLRVSHD